MWSHRLHEVRAWFQHAWAARGPHGVHSPFVYGLITKVLRTKNRSKKYDLIERERARLIRCNDTVEVLDLGAGSRSDNGNRRKISSIARSALQPPAHARALAQLAAHAGATNVLELGTSLGITTAHLAAALPQATIHTIEGSEAIACRAAELWRNVGIQNIELTIGDFDRELFSVLNRMQRVDFIIIDGNHTEEACLHYIELVLPFSSENTVIVVDDIYWSPSMTEGWSRCVADVRFSLSLDFFDFGVLYKKGGRVKEHFVLKRPWFL